MVEGRKNEGAFQGKHIEIFLKTPLFRFKYKIGGEERELLENAVRVSGVVLEAVEAGLVIKVSVISNMRQSEEELPFERIFVPFDKIDFAVIN